jgi:hypothetical protein
MNRLKNLSCEHTCAVNYVVEHPQFFGINMRDVQWVMREGIWSPGNSGDYRKFVDLLYVKRGYLVDVIEIKHCRKLRRHALEQIASAEQFIKEELRMKLDKAGLVYYDTTPFGQEWLRK